MVGNGIPGPVPFTVFDVARTVTSDHYDPRAGVQDAVGKAIANAPFAPVAWHFPAVEIAPFPGPQILLCRFFEQRTVVVDLRGCSLGLQVLEVDHAVDPLGSFRDTLVRVFVAVLSRLRSMGEYGPSDSLGGFAVGMSLCGALFSTLTLSSSGRPTTTVLLESYDLAGALDAARTRHILQPHVQMAAGQLDRVVCSRVQPQPDGNGLPYTALPIRPLSVRRLFCLT